MGLCLSSEATVGGNVMEAQKKVLNKLKAITGLLMDRVDIAQLSWTYINNVKAPRCDVCSYPVQNRTAYLLMRSDRTYKITLAVLCERCREALKETF